MNPYRASALFTVALVTALSGPGFASLRALPSVSGTIWAANRGSHTIRAFDADTGEVVRTVDMAANSQPGDLAVAKGKLYVAEEFAAQPAIAIVDIRSGQILKRLLTGAGSRPHHVHASRGGNLVAVGLYATEQDDE